MSILSFGTNIVPKVGNAGDAMMAWYAKHDPETASQADIAELGQRAEELAHRIAEIEGEYEHDKHNVEGLHAKLDRDLQAAQVIESTADPSNLTASTRVTTLTSQLNAVLSEIETLGGEDGSGSATGRLFDAKTTLSAAEIDLAQFREAHTRAVDDWTNAEARLRKARSDMEHASQQEQYARERAAQAQRDAGLLHGSTTGHVALDAMEKVAETARQAARTANIQAEALRRTQGADVSSIVNETLAGTQTPNDKTESVLDRLSRLKGR